MDSIQFSILICNMFFLGLFSGFLLFGFVIMIVLRFGEDYEINFCVAESFPMPPVNPPPKTSLKGLLKDD